MIEDSATHITSMVGKNRQFEYIHLYIFQNESHADEDEPSSDILGASFSQPAIINDIITMNLWNMAFFRN